MKKIKLVLAIALACGTAVAEEEFPATVGVTNVYQTPTTEWGQPDLQGVWNFSSDIPMQRPTKYGTEEFLTGEDLADRREAVQKGRTAADANAAELLITPEAPPISSNPGGYNDFWFETAGLGDVVRTSHIVYPENGKVPDAVEGAQRQFGGLGPDIPGTRPVRYVVGGIAKNGPEDRGLSERCLVGFNSGPPFTPSLYNNNVQIFQGKDHAVIMTEMVHDARIVPILSTPNEHKMLTKDIRLWSGDSVGWWNENTLVVQTQNFNGMAQTFNSTGSNYDMILMEEFTRTSQDTIDYEFTIIDDSTFTDRITAIIPMTKTSGQLYEYACHEGNYAMGNTLRGMRVEEAGGT